MHTPQIIVLVLMGIGLLLSANQHGQPRKPTNFWLSLIGTMLTIGLLIWGGFFK